MFYSKLPGEAVKCELCYFYCVISEGQLGRCCAYRNLGGELWSLEYEKPMIVDLRTSFFSVYPAVRDPLAAPWFSKQLMISTAFCNFKCPICNNRLGAITELPYVFPRGQHSFSLFNGIGDQKGWQSFQFVAEVTSSEIVHTALQHKCNAVRFAYNEITVFFEYALEIAKLAKENMLEVWIETNGYLTRKAVEAFSPYLDIVVIGVKNSGNTAFYERVSVKNPDLIFETAKRFKELGVWTVMNDLLMETDNVDTVSMFCRKTVDYMGRDTRVFFEVCVPPSAVKSDSTLPFEERAKNFEWTLDVAYAAGLRDALIVDSIPSL
jgi:pyruvate formate lyase activating enzyme